MLGSPELGTTLQYCLISAKHREWISCCDLVGKLCLRCSGLHIYGLCVPSSEPFQQVQKRPNLSLGGPAWSYELDAAIITHPFQLWWFCDSWRSITQEKLTTWWSHHQTTTSERHVKSQGRARSKNEPCEVHLENVMAVNLARGFASAWKEIPCRTAKAFPDTSLGQIQSTFLKKIRMLLFHQKMHTLLHSAFKPLSLFFFPLNSAWVMQQNHFQLRRHFIYWSFIALCDSDN